MTDEEWGKLKTDNPGALTIEIPETEWDEALRVLVKRPNPGAWKRARSMMADDQQRAGALEQLALDCVVTTSDGAWVDVLKTRPGLAETVGGKLSEIAGAIRGSAVKK